MESLLGSAPCSNMTMMNFLAIAQFLGLWDAPPGPTAMCKAVLPQAMGGSSPMDRGSTGSSSITLEVWSEHAPKVKRSPVPPLGVAHPRKLVDVNVPLGRLPRELGRGRGGGGALGNFNFEASSTQTNLVNAFNDKLPRHGVELLIGAIEEGLSQEVRWEPPVTAPRSPSVLPSLVLRMTSPLALPKGFGAKEAGSRPRRNLKSWSAKLKLLNRNSPFEIHRKSKFEVSRSLLDLVPGITHVLQQSVQCETRVWQH